MDQGELIYETKKNSFGLYIFTMLFLIPIFIMLTANGGILDSSGKEFWEQVGFSVFWGVLVLIMLIAAKPSKHNYLFFEEGIEHVEKGKVPIYYSYSDIPLVECYHRVSKSDDHFHHYDCLVFWFSDATYAEINLKDSPEQLKQIWKQLILNNPELIDRLVCVVKDLRSEQLYDELNRIHL